jgi:hypothetical protein
VRDRLKDEFIDLGEKELKNIARPMRMYVLKITSARKAAEHLGSGKIGSTTPLHRRSPLPISAVIQSKNISSTA